jgi:hypothetical protein
VNIESARRSLFSRDVNYLRDMALFWPFVIFSITAVASLYSPSYRQIGLRCAVLAAITVVLARERLLIFLVALGFCAVQSAIALVVHPWSWVVFMVAILTGIPFLLANRYWRKPKLAYQLPDEFGAVDALVAFGSICGSLLVAYFISPYK